jgi:hypothetical protein
VSGQNQDRSVITYCLACSEGHEFEGWFASSTAYDDQAASGALACPICGSADVKKAIMAPAVAPATKAKGRPAKPAPDPKAVRQYVAGFRKFVEENADYVGREFPEEARKIHYGEAEERHIYGESTLEEARDLIKEGIDVAPLPPDPDEMN